MLVHQHAYIEIAKSVLIYKNKGWIYKKEK